MKAVVCKVFGEPETLVVGTLGRAPLQETQVRVAVHAASVGFADILMVQGKYQVRPEPPFAPGAEAAGEVIEVGAKVTRVKPGDRVSVGNYWGAFAEEMVAEEAWTFPMPDGLDYPTAAAFRVAYGTTCFALENRANLRAGEVLAVHGASGGVGLAAVDLGRMMGARVIGTVGSDEKTGIVREYGASDVVNYSTESVRERIKALTGGQGADVIYDAVGGDVFDESLRCINWNGRLLVIGFASGRIPSAPANLALLKNCAILGVFYGAWIARYPDEALEMHTRLMQWCVDGRIKPHISATAPLEEAVDVLGAIARREVTGKVVLTVR